MDLEVVILSKSDHINLKATDQKVDAKGQYYDPQDRITSSFWTYYLNFLSIFVHLGVMYFALSNWCNKSKIAYLYSF